MQKSEIMDRYGHETFEWIQLKKPNYIENEDGTTRDYGPYNGWQTWPSTSELMKDEETGEYTMVWIPYWGNREEAGVASDLFDKFYSATLSDGSKAECGGFIKDLVFEDLFDDVTEVVETPFVTEDGIEDIRFEEVTTNKKIGEVLVSFDFDEDTYNKYQLSLPNPVPDIVESKVAEATNKTTEKLAEGTQPNSVNLAGIFLALDGTEVEGPVTYKYDEKAQTEILKAFMAVSNGAKTYRVSLPGMRSASMTAEQVALLYVEMEMWKRSLEAYEEAYRAYVETFHDADRDMKKFVSDFEYGMELPDEYNDMINEAMENAQAELGPVVEKFRT